MSFVFLSIFLCKTNTSYSWFFDATILYYYYVRILHTGGNSPHKNEDLKARQNPKGIFTLAPCDTRCVARAINGASGGTVGIANAYIADVPWHRLSDEGSQRRNEWICLAHSSSLLLSCVWRWLFDMFFDFCWSNILCKFKRYRILDRKSHSKVKRQIYAREVYMHNNVF